MHRSSSRLQSDDDNDRRLLQNTAGGCRQSFAQLYDRCHTTLVRFAYQYLQDESLVQDVANDTLLVVWQKAKDFRGDSRVKTWILGIAHLKCLEAKRKYLKPREHSLENESALVDTWSHNESTDLHKDIRIALTQLSDDHRVCVELSYVGGFSGEEISNIVGCPLNTVKTRIHAARRQLKRFFEKTDSGLGYNDFFGSGPGNLQRDTHPQSGGENAGQFSSNTSKSTRHKGYE